MSNFQYISNFNVALLVEIFACTDYHVPKKKSFLRVLIFTHRRNVISDNFEQMHENLYQ